MKIILRTGLVILILLPFVAAGQTTGGIANVNIPNNVDVNQIINNVMTWAFGLLLVLAAAFILFAAYLYLTGAGSPETTGKAKNYIIFAAVAIIVAFISRGVVAIVRSLIGA